MNITFSTMVEGHAEIFDPPTPSRDHVPDWYRETHNFLTDRLDDNGVRSGTIKQCMPVIDAITSGYMYTTQSDLWFGQNEDGSRGSSWSVIDYDMISTHSLEQFGHGEIPSDYEQIVYKMHNPWVIKTPPGYSCLFTQPMWRFDTPFYAHSGVVDTDRYPQPINFPFWLRRGFEGLVPVGTPMVQIIPFKRDDWNATTLNDVDPHAHRQWARATRFSFNRYKRLWRVKKVWK
jgi:hypothetical protein